MSNLHDEKDVPRSLILVIRLDQELTFIPIVLALAVVQLTHQLCFQLVKVYYHSFRRVFLREKHSTVDAFGDPLLVIGSLAHFIQLLAVHL